MIYPNLIPSQDTAASQASEDPAEAHSKFPAPDLRGIDAATHHEWRMLGVPAKEMLIQEKDLPEIIKRACLTYVASNPQPKGTRQAFEAWYSRRYGYDFSQATDTRKHAAMCDAWEVWQAAVQAPAPAHGSALLTALRAAEASLTEMQRDGRAWPVDVRALESVRAAIASPAVGAEPLKGQEMRRAFEADYRKRHDSRLCCESEWRGWQAGVAACISGAALSKPPVQDKVQP